MAAPDVVPADDRGLAYGDGLFETMRITASGRVPLAQAHCCRMRQGARRLNIPFDEQHWWSELARLTEQGGGTGKLLLTRGSGGRGYAPPAHPTPRLIASHHPLPAAASGASLRIGQASLQLADQPRLAGLKHTSRLEQVLARAEAEEHGWDEALLCGPGGRPQCLTSMNLFALVDGELRTPPTNRAGVAGVLREWLLEHGAKHTRVPLVIRPLTANQLRRASEVLATNAVAGVVPVGTLGVWQWSVGPVTRALMDAVGALFE